MRTVWAVSLGLNSAAVATNIVASVKNENTEWAIVLAVILVFNVLCAVYCLVHLLEDR